MKPRRRRSRRFSVNHHPLPSRTTVSPRRKRSWLERINDYLKQSPLIEFLGHAAKLTVVVAVISGAWTGIKWQLEADNRAKERHYRAWELINAARGSTGDGGRRDALQDLNKDGVSLTAAPLQQAWLSRVDLKGARLEDANLQGAFLGGANLQARAFSSSFVAFRCPPKQPSTANGRVGTGTLRASDGRVN